MYVDEETSINRQMQRAELAQAHNRRVKDAGMGEQQLQEERSTDVAPEKARKRYQIFKQHYPAVLRLKQFFPFHLIDASYSLSDTQEQITQVCGGSVMGLLQQASWHVSLTPAAAGHAQFMTGLQHALWLSIFCIAAEELDARELYCCNHCSYPGADSDVVWQDVSAHIRCAMLAGTAVSEQP